MPRLALTLAVFIVTAPTAHAQGADFNPRLLQHASDSMSISLVRDGSAVPVGELWDSFTDVRSARGPALRRIYRTLNQAFGPHTETTMVRLPDLSLLSRRTYSQSTSDSIVATGDSLLGWRDAGQGVRVRVARRSEPNVIEGSFFDALIRGGPLSPTYAVQVRAYLSVQDSIATLTARVTGSEAVRQHDGTMTDSWKVDMDFAGLSTTLWIAKKSRALVRQVIRLTPTVQMLMAR